MQGIYGDIPVFITSSQNLFAQQLEKRRNKDGELVVDKGFGVKDVLIAIFLDDWAWFALLLDGRSTNHLDALTNGLSFTAQQRQVKGHIDGFYLWLLVDLLSFILFMAIGNQVVAFSYFGMFAQGSVGIMIWQKGKGNNVALQNKKASKETL